MSAKIDFILNYDTDFGENYIWKDSTKTPIPMLNWTASVIIKEAEYLSSVLELTQGAGITLGDSDGTILVEITKSQIATLDFNTGLYTLILTNTTSEPTLFSSGTVTILRR